MSNIGFIKRYIFIIRYIRQHPFCTIKELLDKLSKYLYWEGVESGTSTRTLTRDINEGIPSVFNIKIEYNPTRKGYYISDEDFEDPNTKQILESFEIISSMKIESGVPDFMILEKRKSKGTEHLIPLSKAIKQKEIVSFEYRKFFPETTEIRTVEPYILKESRGRWYLLGFDSEGDQSQIKTFGLDRIHSLNSTDKKYKPQKGIKWGDLYEHCFAMFTDEQAERVVFKLDHRDGNYVESMPIHHSQKITKHPKFVIVELYIAITLDFIMELMSRSWSIEILEPISLRKKMEQIYKEALQRNFM